MAGYKEPSFQDRVAAAGKARETALARLKSKPPTDPAVLAERAAKAHKREAAKAQRATEKAEARKLAEEEKAAAVASVPTEAERKTARDVRYAQRKARKSSR